MTSLLSQRSNDGDKGLHMCQCCRITAMVATFGGQEIQVDDTTHQPLPVRPFLPGKDKKNPNKQKKKKQNMSTKELEK